MYPLLCSPRSWMPERACFLFCLLIFAGIYSGAAPPVRLSVDAAKKSIELGQDATVTITLRDAYGNASTAQKDYPCG
jgi:hypothetical protein